MKTKLLVLALIMSSVTACATFSDNPTLSDQEFARTNIDRVPRSIYLQFEFSGQAEESAQLRSDLLHELALGKMSLVSDKAQADEIWNLKVERTVKGNIGSYLVIPSFLTFGLIPYWSDQTYAAKLEIQSTDGKILATAQSEVALTYVVETLMLPLTPFYWPPSTEERTILTLYRKLITQTSRMGAKELQATF